MGFTITIRLLLIGLSAGLFLSCKSEDASLTDLTYLGSYHSGHFMKGGSEITAYDPETQRVFIVNGATASIDIVSLSTPHRPEFITSLSMTPFGKSANSISIYGGIIAVAIEADPIHLHGNVTFFSTSGEFIQTVPVGALPDMVTFSKDGKFVVVACEGEPSDDYTVDPEGSVWILELKQADSLEIIPHEVHFRDFNIGSVRESEGKLLHIYGPNATVAQDLEPEYVTLIGDSIFVTFQENNAVGLITISDKKIQWIRSLGYKNHALTGNELDASDRDVDGTKKGGGKIHIRTWPVYSLYQPDGITTLRKNNQTFLLTANEGDSRGYSAFNEDVRVNQIKLNPLIFPPDSQYQKDDRLGRLTVTKTLGKKGEYYDQLMMSGARSFSIWSDSLILIWDSGSLIEKIVSLRLPETFDFLNEQNEGDSRSDNRGSEPESIVIFEHQQKQFAVIGLERTSGVIIFDVTNPYHPEFVMYTLRRNFEYPISADYLTSMGDISPEGLFIIPSHQSPTKMPLLVLSHEVSGTTSFYEWSTSQKKSFIIEFSKSDGNITIKNSTRHQFTLDILTLDRKILKTFQILPKQSVTQPFKTEIPITDLYLRLKEGDVISILPLTSFTRK